MPPCRCAPSGSAVTIAIENLAPVFPGPEPLSASPMVLRGLANRIGSERVGICLDLGHAHIVAERRRTSLEALIEPVLDTVTLFHLHDNLGARWQPNGAESGVDPLRLDLHLPPGRGTLPWERLAPALAAHRAPLMLEVHPPYRPRAEELYRSAAELLSPADVVGRRQTRSARSGAEIRRARQRRAGEGRPRPGARRPRTRGTGR